MMVNFDVIMKEIVFLKRAKILSSENDKFSTKFADLGKQKDYD